MACSFSQHCWTSGRVDGEDPVNLEALGHVLGRVEALNSELTHLSAGQRRVEITLRDIRDGMAALMPFAPGRGATSSAELKAATSEGKAAARPQEVSSARLPAKAVAPASTQRSACSNVAPLGDVSPIPQCGDMCDSGRPLFEDKASCPLERPMDFEAKLSCPPERLSRLSRGTNSYEDFAASVPARRPSLRRAKSRWNQERCNSVADLSGVEGWNLQCGQTSSFHKESTLTSKLRASVTTLAMDLEEMTSFAKCINSPRFDNTMAFFIVLNSIVLGVQVQVMATWEIDQPPKLLSATQTALSCLFLMETVMRMAALKRKFFTNSEFMWNIFDLILVVLSLVEFILDRATSGDDAATSSFTLLRVLRVLRIVRVARVIRVFRFFRELRMMVFSLLGSLQSLFWAMVLLFVILFVVGVYITQSVTSYRSSSNADEGVELGLEQYFGTLFETMYYLLQAVTGGINWGEVTAPLLHLGWWYGVFMSLFTCFTLLALLNIVTGVFVEGAIQKAQNDKEAKIQDELEQETGKIQRLEEVFAELDSDSSGYIDLDEFEQLMADPRVRAYFRSIGLHISTAYHLFRLLDLDNSQTVNISEFVMGCLRLQGAAKNVDVATLMYENKRMMMKWVTFMDFVEEQFTALHEAIAGNAPTASRDTLSRGEAGVVLAPAAEAPVAEQAPAAPVARESVVEAPEAEAVVDREATRMSERRSTWRSKVAQMKRAESSLNVYEKADVHKIWKAPWH